MIAILQIVDKLVLIYTIMIFVRILSSWVPEWQNTKFMRFIAAYTDPYLDLFRQLIPPLGMIDLSPMIAIFSLQMFQWMFARVLIGVMV